MPLRARTLQLWFCGSVGKAHGGLRGSGNWGTRLTRRYKVYKGYKGYKVRSWTKLCEYVAGYDEAD